MVVLRIGQFIIDSQIDKFVFCILNNYFFPIILCLSKKKIWLLKEI